MTRRTIGLALTALMLLASMAPAAAAPGKKASKKELEKHAVEFVANNPAVLTDATAQEAYTKERMALLGMQTEPALEQEGDVSILCGSFCTQITYVYGISTSAKNVDELAFPIWESTVRADWGSGGASGTWTATWSKSTSSSWNVTASITAEAKVQMLAKLSGTVGGGYSRTTSTTWSGSTSVTFSIPEGKKQTLYAYEKGTYWTFNCDCQVAYSGGSSRMTVTGASSGKEAYPYQATTFRKGSIVSI